MPDNVWHLKYIWIKKHFRRSVKLQMAVWTGLEPATSAVTGRHSKPTELPDHLQWRRQRDLNPRAGYPTYSLSRGASSASWVCLHRTAYLIYHIDLGHASIFCIKIINLKWKVKFHFRYCEFIIKICALYTKALFIFPKKHYDKIINMID